RVLVVIARGVALAARLGPVAPPAYRALRRRALPIAGPFRLRLSEDGAPLRRGAHAAAFGLLVPLHLHVAAQRQPGNAVVGLADLDAEGARPHAETEDLHTDPAPLGEQEMAELVETDHQPEDEDDG